MLYLEHQCRLIKFYQKANLIETIILNEKVSNDDIWLIFKTIHIPYHGSNISDKALDHTI